LRFSMSRIFLKFSIEKDWSNIYSLCVFIFLLFLSVSSVALPPTPGGFAKCFAFRKTFRCTKSLKGLRTAKPPGDVAEARRDFATSHKYTQLSNVCKRLHTIVIGLQTSKRILLKSKLTKFLKQQTSLITKKRKIL